MAAGAGGGIAATFNAPLGGILFAVELLLVSINAQSILIVSIATITATAIGRILLGATPAFDIPALEIPHFGNEPFWGLLALLPLGLLCGGAAAVFIRAIYWAEDRFDAMPGTYYSRHLTGMLLVGLMLYALQRYSGHFYVQGVGYATIVDILSQILGDPGFLLLLFLLKLIATCLTLGSGASGGVFSPSLFMGAAVGAAYGHGVQAFLPGIDLGTPVYAIAGMAAMIGASTGAVFTSIVMLAEMTGDHNAILPVVLCVVSAYALRKAICPPSIYTLKLDRRGHRVPEGLTAAISSAQRLGDIASKDFAAREAGAPPPATPGVVLWTRAGRIESVERRFLNPARPEEPPVAAEAPHFLSLPADCNLVEALRAMRAVNAQIVLISRDPAKGRGEDVTGVVSAAEIAGALQAGAEMM
jgi:CIC family chloride channel protein